MMQIRDQQIFFLALPEMNIAHSNISELVPAGQVSSIQTLASTLAQK